MKFQINDVKKAFEFIELMKFIKNISQHITFMCTPEHIYIQTMDSSHVCLLDVYIPADWFHSYETQNVTFSMYASILVKVLSMYTIDSMIDIYISEEDDDKIHINLIHDKEQKIFAIPLMDIEREILKAKDIDTKLDFMINTKKLDKYINELILFGEEITIECNNDKLFLGTKNDEGSFNIEIKNETLEEFNVIDDYAFKGAYSIKYLQYILKLSIIYPKIHLYLDDESPLMITFDSTNIKIKLFVAPKCSDSDE